MIQAPISLYKHDPQLECLRDCSKCSLSPKRGVAQRVVEGVGNLNADVLILGQAPSKNEDETGFPLVGASFWFLKELQARYKFNYLEEAFVTNAALCYPENDDPPTGTQLKSCKQNLSFIINKMPNLKFVLTLGAVPLKVIEGEKSVLDTRLGIPAKVDWLPSHYDQSDGRRLHFEPREFINIPFYHPARVLREQNIRKKRKLEEFAIKQMAFFIEFRNKVKDINNFQMPYNFHYCTTVKDSWEVLDYIYDKAEHLVIDYETSGIKCGAAEPICLAIAINDWESYCFFFNQIVDLPKEEWYKTKAKKGKTLFQNKWKLMPWFEDDPDFAQKFMKSEKMVNLLHSETITGYKNKPTIGAWNFTFDSNANWEYFGYPICERQDQLERLKDPFCLPFTDSMFAFRLANSELKSISLETAVSYLSPLEASQKSFAEVGLTKPQIQEWGYALQARKPVDGAYLKKVGNEFCDFLAAKGKKDEWDGDLALVERDFCVPLRMPKWEVLAYRACVDVSLEWRLSFRIEELLQSNDVSAFNMSLRDLTDEIFL